MLHWYNSSVLWRLIRLVMKFCSSSVNCLYQWILIWSTPNWIVNWLGTKQPGKFFHYRVLPGFTRAFTELLPSFFFLHSLAPPTPPPHRRSVSRSARLPSCYRVSAEPVGAMGGGGSTSAPGRNWRLDPPAADCKSRAVHARLWPPRCLPVVACCCLLLLLLLLLLP